MGIAYRCDPDLALAVIVWDGEVTADDAREHLTAVSADPVWMSSRVFISEATSVSVASRPAFSEIAQVGDEFLQDLAPQIGRAKWAVVADSIFDDVRKLESHLSADSQRMVVFSNLATACIWMNLDVTAVQRIVNELREQIRNPDPA